MERAALLWAAGDGLVSAPRLRCAIYTRKSSEEGLDQQFNSLDAQHDACAAFITSQAGSGWRPLAERYDDGGYSGGSMERPALQRLLTAIAAGQIDVVVVYKIDRLTRALCDFARMVDLFDRHQASFVSVTQAFNTTTSMGRLTLNVLLSFAQFEREVTGERIRDKIAASKARGLWMGGLPPLGYDLPEPGSRTLRLNAAEAEIVRTIFMRYRELGSVHALQRWLCEHAMNSKIYVTRAGRQLGGMPYSRGALFHMLRNRIYLGLIVHKEQTFPGEHPPIVSPELFEAVQVLLNNHTRRTSSPTETPVAATRALLTGRLFDTYGKPMSPTFSRGARGKLYRYYVSQPLQQGQPRTPGDASIRRVSATALESMLNVLLARLLPEIAISSRLATIHRVEVHAHTLDLLLPARLLAGIRLRLFDGEFAVPEADETRGVRISLPVRMRRRGGRTEIRSNAPQRSGCDAVLIKALRQAYAMLHLDAQGLPVLSAAPASSYTRRLVRLALLAPDLQVAILAGTQPDGLSLTQFLSTSVPLSWSEQRQAF